MRNWRRKFTGWLLGAPLALAFFGCSGGEADWKIRLDPGETLLRADLPPPAARSSGALSQSLRRVPERFDLGAARALRRDGRPGAPALPPPGFPNTVVELSLDPSARTLQGVAVIEVTATDAAVSSLSFHLSAAGIDAVEAQNPAATYAYADEILTVTPAAPIAPGASWSVTVRWHDRDVEREVDFTPEGGGVVLANRLGLPSTFFTYGYHFWPRPRGVPDIKNIEFRVTHPKDLELIMSGDFVSRQDGAAATTVWWVEKPVRWNIVLALASYQSAQTQCGSASLRVAAMPGVSIDGYPIAPGTYAPIHKKLCDEYVARFGPPVFSSIVVAGVDERFTSGYSTPGLILAPNYSFDDDGSGSFAERDFFLGHELSHQWWGNDVFYGAMRDIWLIEGMADYVTMKALAALYGAADIQNLWRWEVRPLLDWWASGGADHPLVPGAPIDMEPRIYYIKGAWVLRMLEGVLGETAMRTLLRAIREGHAFAAVTTEEFAAAAQAQANEDIGWFFEQWAYGTGWLALGETHAIQGRQAAVTVTQSKPWSADPVRYFETPLLIRAQKGKAVADKTVTLEGETQDFVVDLP